VTDADHDLLVPLLLKPPFKASRRDRGKRDPNPDEGQREHDHELHGAECLIHEFGRGFIDIEPICRVNVPRIGFMAVSG
jgi:hypothetical protein